MLSFLLVFNIFICILPYIVQKKRPFKTDSGGEKVLPVKRLPVPKPKDKNLLAFFPKNIYS